LPIHQYMNFFRCMLMWIIKTRSLFSQYETIEKSNQWTSIWIWYYYPFPFSAVTISNPSKNEQVNGHVYDLTWHIYNRKVSKLWYNRSYIDLQLTATKLCSFLQTTPEALETVVIMSIHDVTPDDMNLWSLGGETEAVITRPTPHNLVKSCILI
jgi:hypothetical protein